MRKLTATLCLTLAVILGSVRMSASGDSQKKWADYREDRKGLTAYRSGDYATALRIWKPLAEQGNASAQFGLGVMFYDGIGVPQDYKTALKWYKLAAEQGSANAQYQLSVMYGLGHGVIQDWVYAHMWGNLAAKKGNADGGKVRDIATTKMTPAQIKKAKKLARECALFKKYKEC